MSERAGGRAVLCVSAAPRYLHLGISSFNCRSHFTAMHRREGLPYEDICKAGAAFTQRGAARIRGAGSGWPRSRQEARYLCKKYPRSPKGSGARVADVFGAVVSPNGRTDAGRAAYLVLAPRRARGGGCAAAGAAILFPFPSLISR